MADLNFNIENLTAESAENLLKSGNSFSQIQILDLIIVFLKKISSHEKMYALDRIRGFMPKNLDIPVVPGETQDVFLLRKNNILIRAKELQKLLRENYGENKELPNYIIQMKDQTLDAINGLEKRIKYHTNLKSSGGVIDVSKLESDIESDSKKLEKMKEWMEEFYTEFLVFAEFYRAVQKLEGKKTQDKLQEYKVKKSARSVFTKDNRTFVQR